MSDTLRRRREHTQTVFDRVVSSIRAALGDQFDEVIWDAHLCVRNRLLWARRNGAAE